MCIYMHTHTTHTYTHKTRKRERMGGGLRKDLKTDRKVLAEVIQEG